MRQALSTQEAGSGTVTSYKPTELKPYQITTDGHGSYTINKNLKQLHRNLELALASSKAANSGWVVLSKGNPA